MNVLQRPLLQIQNLKKSFTSPEGEKQLIVDIPAFTLRAGEQIALRGESGSGKTTFLHMIAGILAADEGSLRFGEHDLVTMKEHARDRLRAESIGYIFQTFNLLQGYTCLENVMLGMAFGSGANRTQAIDWLEHVGLSHRLHHYPRQLSTGQQQRVAVARALAKRPQLVLADEPTGNLDRLRAQDALALVRQTCRENGAALLLVSHDPDVLCRFEMLRNFHELNLAMKETAS